METEWFKDWFDSAYYHALYAHRNEEEAESFIHRLMAYISIPKESSILDLACGKGRHSRTLHSLGFQVLGVDLSAQSIAHAKRFQGNGLSFEVHDMRKPILGMRFDAIVNLFTSFGYFETHAEHIETLRVMQQMLSENGILIIDFMNANKVLAHLVSSEIVQRPPLQFEIQRSVQARRIFKEISFEAEGRRFQFTEKVMAYTDQDFEEMFAESGLVCVKKFGNYQLEPFDSQNSDRLIMIIQKIGALPASLQAH